MTDFEEELRRVQNEKAWDADIRELDRAERDKHRRHRKLRNRLFLLALLAVALGMVLMTTADAGKPAEMAPPPVKVESAVEDVETVVLVPAIDPLEKEKTAIAKTVWGEARGCSLEGQRNVVWTILARYDDGRFGNTILEVVQRPNQFLVYRESNPVDQEIYSLVEDVLQQWLSGNPGPGYLYFWGDGKENHFREG